MSGESLADTVPDLRPPHPEATSPYRPYSVDMGGRTHVGHVRTNNEDNFHIMRFGRYLQTIASSLPDARTLEEYETVGYGYCVADGLGGHAAAGGDAVDEDAHACHSPQGTRRNDSPTRFPRH